LPTLGDDPAPLECQGAHGGLLTFASGAVRPGGGSRPEGVLERLSGIRLARLPQERRPAIAPAEPARLPPAFDPRRYPAAAAQFINCGPSVAVRAQSGREACRLDGTSARQRGQQGRVLRRATQRLNLVGKRPDSRKSGLHWCREGVAHEDGGANHRLLWGQGDGLVDSRNSVGARRLTYGVRLVKEPFESRWPALRDHLERRPTEQQITDQGGAEVINPWSHLRDRGLQPCRHPSAEPGAVMHQAPSMLPQLVQGACLGLVWPPRLEMIPMMEAQREPRVCIARSIFGPAGRERLPVLGEGGRGDRGEPKPVMRQERREEWPTRLLQTDSALPSGNAGAQGGGPGCKLFRGVREDERCCLAGRRIHQPDLMLGV
jgi:hypothetical protein